MDVPCESALTLQLPVYTLGFHNDTGAMRHRAPVGSPNLESVCKGGVVSAVTATVRQRAN